MARRLDRHHCGGLALKNPSTQSVAAIRGELADALAELAAAERSFDQARQALKAAQSRAHTARRASVKACIEIRNFISETTRFEAATCERRSHHTNQGNL